MRKNEVGLKNRVSVRLTLRTYGLMLLAAIAVLAPAKSSVAQCLPAPSGLVAWWPGDGNLLDIFGGNNGTAQGGLTSTGTGFVSQAMTFDGTNGYVSIPDSALWHPTNVTVECWVRFNALDGPGTA